MKPLWGSQLRTEPTYSSTIQEYQRARSEFERLWKKMSLSWIVTRACLRSAVSSCFTLNGLASPLCTQLKRYATTGAYMWSRTCYFILIHSAATQFENLLFLVELDIFWSANKPGKANQRQSKVRIWISWMRVDIFAQAGSHFSGCFECEREGQEIAPKVNLLMET